MTERVRWADERRPIVVTALLFVVGATAPLLTVSPFVQSLRSEAGRIRGDDDRAPRRIRARG